MHVAEALYAVMTLILFTSIGMVFYIDPADVNSYTYMVIFMMLASITVTGPGGLAKFKQTGEEMTMEEHMRYIALAFFSSTLSLYVIVTGHVLAGKILEAVLLLLVSALSVYFAAKVKPRARPRRAKIQG